MKYIAYILFFIGLLLIGLSFGFNLPLSSVDSLAKYYEFVNMPAQKIMFIFAGVGLVSFAAIMPRNKKNSKMATISRK